MTKIVLMDVDGVVANFAGPVLDAVNHTFHKQYRVEGLRTYESLFDDLTSEERDYAFEMIARPGFCADLPLLDGAQEAVGLIRSLGGEVVFCTSPWISSRHWQYERHRYLVEHFGADADHVIQCRAKQHVHGDFLVDDHVKTVRKWQEHHTQGVGVVWDCPHNQLEAAPGPRTRDWSHLIGEIIFPPISKYQHNPDNLPCESVRAQAMRNGKIGWVCTCA